MRTYLLASALLTLNYLAQAQTNTPDPVVDFLRKNPTRSALYVIRNDTVLISQRPDQKMPLASAVKTIIAIEFARQVAAGKIDPTERVPLADLDLYYLPDTDGGAHPEWKKQMTTQQQTSNGSVSLLEVAKGMILFSSNANTEYLMDKLGLDAINANLKTLNLPNHAPIYPIVSALFLYSTTNPAVTTKRVESMSMDRYRADCQRIHEKIKADKDGTVKETFVFPGLTLQKLWSDRLPGSTVREYTSVMQKINARTYFPAPVQTILDSIMEWPMVINPGNKTVFKHLGAKGGSTGFVLTNAFYAETQKGDRISAAVFFNDLTGPEMELLRPQFDGVIRRCIGKASSAKLAAALE